MKKIKTNEKINIKMNKNINKLINNLMFYLKQKSYLKILIIIKFLKWLFFYMVKDY